MPPPAVTSTISGKPVSTSAAPLLSPVPAPVAAPPPAAVPRGWIVSPRYDTLFFTASVFVPMLLWAAFSVDLLTGVGVYLAFQLAFNMPHNFQTWTMSILDGEDRAKNGKRYLIAAIVILAVFGIPMLLSPDGVYPWVRDALIYWGYYHLVRQHYGFLRIYERKMGGVSELESKLYGRYLDAVCYLPFLIRWQNPEWMTIHAGDLAMWIRHPVLPATVWIPIAVLYASVILAAIVHHVWMVIRGRPSMWPRALLLLSVTLGFGVATLVVHELLVAIALVTAFHNLQYLGLVGFHNKNRAAMGHVEGNRPIGWLAEGKWIPYALATFLYGAILFVPRGAFSTLRYAELPITLVVALHYYVDARMWRFKDYPRRGLWLKLKGG